MNIKLIAVFGALLLLAGVVLLVVVYFSLGSDQAAVADRDKVEENVATLEREEPTGELTPTQLVRLAYPFTLGACAWPRLAERNTDLLIGLMAENEDWYPESVERVEVVDEWLAQAYMTDRPQETRRSITPCALKTTITANEDMVAAGQYNAQALWDEIQEAGFVPQPRQTPTFDLNGQEVTIVLKSAGGIVGDSQTFVRNDEAAQTLQLAHLSDQTGTVVLTLSDVIPHERLLSYLELATSAHRTSQAELMVSTAEATSTNPYFTFVADNAALETFNGQCAARYQPQGDVAAFIAEYVTFDESQFTVGEPFMAGKEIARAASTTMAGCGESAVLSSEYAGEDELPEVAYQAALLDNGWFGNGIELYPNGSGEPIVLGFLHAGGPVGNRYIYGTYDQQTAQYRFLVAEERRVPHGPSDPNGFQNCPCTFEYQFTITKTVTITAAE